MFQTLVVEWVRRGALVCAGAAGLLAMPAFGAEADAKEPEWPQHELHADRWWLLNLPEGQRVDASGLLLLPNGDCWIVNDQVAAVYRVAFREGTNVADLVRIPEIFTAAHRSELLRSPREIRLDCEGLARDAEGRIYISEEGRRWVLRWDPATGAMAPLKIDWSPVSRWFHPTDINASFEGITIGGTRLYVANERGKGRVIVVDLGTLKVVDDFAVAPADSIGDDNHYSDLTWADDALWILMRDVRKLLKVDPQAKRVLAEFDYGSMETQRTMAYGSFFAPGFMEGVAIDETHIWLLSDNNGVGRRMDSKDTRPTLFRCPRPK